MNLGCCETWGSLDMECWQERGGSTGQKWLVVDGNIYFQFSSFVKNW